MSKKSTNGAPLTLPPQRIKASRISRRTVVTVPAEFAKHLDILEGSTELQVEIVGRTLVYRVLSSGSLVA